MPALTINTAAKVANCISDNLLTNMISRAMATGKPIVAAVDGCCPDNEVRAKIGFKVTDAYKMRMRSNLDTGHKRLYAGYSQRQEYSKESASDPVNGEYIQ